MECNNIQERLSAYIEGILSAEERELIDEHLKSCQKCNESLSALRKTIAHLNNLEDIEPPSWLTQKVMARIISEAKPEKGILQKLFYPLHIKLPIEVVAAILIALTTIYIFKTMQPMKLAEMPSEEVPQVLSREKEEVPVLEETKPAPALPAKQPMPAKKQEIMDKAEAPEASPSTIKQSEIRSGDETRQFAGAAPKDETEVSLRVPRAKALAERKEKIINLTISVEDIKTAGNEIEKAITQLGGKVIKTESFRNRDVLTVELDSRKVDELRQKPEQIGEVKEKEIPSVTLQGNIEIKIETLKTSM